MVTMQKYQKTHEGIVILQFNFLLEWFISSEFLAFLEVFCSFILQFYSILHFAFFVIVLVEPLVVIFETAEIGHWNINILNNFVFNLIWFLSPRSLLLKDVDLLVVY